MIEKYQQAYSHLYEQYVQLCGFLNKIDFKHNAAKITVEKVLKVNLLEPKQILELQQLINNLSCLQFALVDSSSFKQSIKDSIIKESVIQEQAIGLIDRIQIELGERLSDMILENVFDMAKISNIKELDNFLKQNFDLLSALESKKAELNHPKILSYADVINYILLFACDEGCVVVIKHLLEQYESYVDMSFKDSKGAGFLIRICSEDSQYDKKSLLETLDLLINKASTQGKLQDALMANGEFNGLLYYAAQIEDVETAVNVITRLIDVGKSCGADLFASRGNPLIAPIELEEKTNDDTKIVIHHLYKTLIDTYPAHTDIIQEFLEYCAKNNYVETMLYTMNIEPTFIKVLYNEGNKEVLRTALDIAFDKNYNNFVMEYEDVLTKILGDEPYFSENEY